MRSGRESPRIQLAPPTDTAEWARMIAAARIADNVETVDGREINVDPMTRARLNVLLPIARAQHQEFVLKAASEESQNIGMIFKHCHKFLPPTATRPVPKAAKRRSATRRAAKPWAKIVCRRRMRSLRVPFTFITLQPISRNAIAYLLTPQSSPWHLLRAEIYRGLSDEDKSQKTVYNSVMYDGLRRCRITPDRVYPLFGKLFVTAVLEHAPPLVRTLPPQWTAAEKSNDLLEALQALLQLGNTCPLARLVASLSKGEYDILVQERLCLSQVLGASPWSPTCNSGRSLDTYKAFARALQNFGEFTGSLAVVPPKQRSAKSIPGKLLAGFSSETELLSDSECSAGTYPKASESDVVHSGSNRLRREARKHLSVGADAESRPHVKIKLRLPGVPIATRAESGAQQASSDHQSDNGELSVPVDEGHDRDNPFNLDKPLDVEKLLDLYEPHELDREADDKQLNELSSGPTGRAANASMDWLSAVRQMANGHDNSLDVALRPASPKLEQVWDLDGLDALLAQDTPTELHSERPASLAKGNMARSSTATVAMGDSAVPAAGAVAALALVVFLALFQLRARTQGLRSSSSLRPVA